MDQERILVVDNEKENLDAARAHFGRFNNLNILVDGCQEAFALMNGIDKAFIDMYMQGPENLKLDVLKKLEEFDDPHNPETYLESLKVIRRGISEEAPLGILVAEEAERRDIPYIITSSFSHHSEKLEAVCQYMAKRMKNFSLAEGVRGKTSSGRSVEKLANKPDIDVKTGFDKGYYDKNRIEFWEKAHRKLETGRINRFLYLKGLEDSGYSKKDLRRIFVELKVSPSLQGELEGYYFL